MFHRSLNTRNGARLTSVLSAAATMKGHPMSNETKGAGLPGSTAREPAGDTASRAVKQAVEETKQTGGTGAALGPQAKSQPAQPR